MSTNKSFSTETSERYSRALFEVAQEASELEKIENDIKNFVFLLNNSLEIKNFIHNPTQSKENQNNVLKLLAEKLNFSKNLKNFFFLLIEKRRIFFVEKIIDSTAAGDSFNAEILVGLLRDIPLADAINNGGTTLNDFSNVNGNPGYFSQVLNVYGRDKMPCIRCSGKIKRIIQNQRATYFCPKCQI